MPLFVLACLRLSEVGGGGQPGNRFVCVRVACVRAGGREISVTWAIPGQNVFLILLAVCRPERAKTLPRRTFWLFGVFFPRRTFWHLGQFIFPRRFNVFALTFSLNCSLNCLHTFGLNFCLNWFALFPLFACTCRLNFLP